MKLRIGHRGQGFTLIEILLVVAAIAILAGIVILAINPSKQLGDTRNAQRRADVLAILNAVYQYEVDLGGKNDVVPDYTVEICRTGAECSGYADLSMLTDAEKYLTSMPIDPQAGDRGGTGYFIYRTENNRLVVEAPLAEQGVTIGVTR
jgi:prepilin-type N-terminal cleavage/methylation domain-containing protein